MLLPGVQPLVFGNLPADRCDFATARSAVLGAPYDGSIPTRGGTKDGPAAILLASQEMETYEIELDDDPSRLGIATLGMVEVDVDGPAAMAARVEAAIGPVADAGKLPVLLGGEHSVTVGAVRALADRYPDLSVLQLDAHGDLRDSYQGSRMSHACVMRRVLERCPAAGIGIRTLGDEERDLIRSGGAVVVRHDELRRDPSSIDRALARLSGHIYLTVDLDVLDPGIMPAVAFPSPAAWAGTRRSRSPVASPSARRSSASTSSSSPPVSARQPAPMRPHTLSTG